MTICSSLPVKCSHIFPLIYKLRSQTLTVLNYHRIADVEKDGRDTFLQNISATPSSFARQMDFLSENFNVISGAELLAWLQDKSELPPHAALITFDDGYQDNWSNAYPVLKKRNLPAIIFLTTNFIDKHTPFYWDKLAYAFYHTKKNTATLPLLGKQHWDNHETARKLTLAWAEASKLLHNEEKEAALSATLDALDITIPQAALSDLPLRWDQIREMANNGIEMGSHTLSHPILTRISLDQVRTEVVESKRRIEEEIGKPIFSFAYPNGGAADFNSAIQNILKQAGYSFAFSLMPGPTTYNTLRRKPYAIRRIFLGHIDIHERFIGKILGMSYIKNFLRK